MFTQCSKCETVFRLSAETLRAAGGQVRCGKCGEVFNALARLAEDPTSFIQGDSPLDMETRADVILEFPPSLDLANPVPMQIYGDDDVTPEAEIAHLQIGDPVGEDDAADSDPATEKSLEFTLPPGELDRIFLLESRPSALRRLVPDADLPEPAPHPESRHLDEHAAQETQEPETELLMTPIEMMHPVPRAAKPRPPETPRRPSGPSVPDDVQHAVRAVNDTPALPDLGPAPRRKIPFNAWLGAAIALGLLLAWQIVHGSRDWVAAHTQAGSGVRGLFSMVGAAIPTSANLAVYQLRQWGVSGDPDAVGVLRVRASVLNTSAQLQPYPLLRVTLANRFGTRIGAREFEPSEYLGSPTARLLNPGERLDATLDLLDPGKDAEGFEIDVCLRNSAKRLYCSGDSASSK